MNIYSLVEILDFIKISFVYHYIILFFTNKGKMHIGNSAEAFADPRDTPPRPISFNFTQFSVKSLPKLATNPVVGVPWEILDPFGIC